MQAGTLREILLVKAIEEADRPGQILPWGDRERAARDALRSARVATDEINEPAARSRVLAALAARASALAGPLQQRYPVLGDLLARSGWPRWAGLALLAAAFCSGYGLSAMNDARRINILALPFLGLLAWNLAVYVWVAIGGARRMASGTHSATRLAGSAVRSIGRRLGPLVARTAQVDTLLADAVKRFVTDWTHFGAPVLAQQLRQWLHLAAAALAFGLVFGLYQRGIGHDFVAGWESLWFDPSQVKWLIDTLFGPIAHWAGIPMPATVDEVARLQFRPDGTGGASARSWIHLLALVLSLWVVLPRLLLAGIAGFKARRLQRVPELPGDLVAYAGQALGAGGQGLPLPVRVIPYAYAPAASAIALLGPELQEWFGRGARAELQPAIAYGDEAALGSRLQGGRDRCVLLMNLASTPELENHGSLLERARESARADSSAPCRLLLDETSYAERFGGDAGPGGRLEQRRQLWREFAARHAIEVRFLAAKTTA